MQVKRTTALISNDDEERESKKDVNPEIMAQEVDEMEEKIGDDTLSKDDHKYMDVSLDNCLHGNEVTVNHHVLSSITISSSVLWSILVMWLRCRFLATANDGSNHD